jgi:hypothetical protein
MFYLSKIPLCKMLFFLLYQPLIYIRQLFTNIFNMDRFLYSPVLSLEHAVSRIERAVHRTMLSTRISEPAANWEGVGGTPLPDRSFVNPRQAVPSNRVPLLSDSPQTSSFKGTVSQDFLLQAGIVYTGAGVNNTGGHIFPEFYEYSDRDDTKFTTYFSKNSGKLATCVDNSGGQQ